jgi:CDI immunity proteins
MKLESNWRDKTLEHLEKKDSSEMQFDSHLIKRVNILRKTPLGEFQVEDLRLMIGQNLSLDYLIPLAIEILEKNLFAEGDFYEGDLLQNVLNIEPSFWSKNQVYWVKIDNLLKIDKEKVRIVGIRTDIFYQITLS